MEKKVGEHGLVGVSNSWDSLIFLNLEKINGMRQIESSKFKERTFHKLIRRSSRAMTFIPMHHARRPSDLFGAPKSHPKHLFNFPLYFPCVMRGQIKGKKFWKEKENETN